MKFISDGFLGAAMLATFCLCLWIMSFGSNSPRTVVRYAKYLREFCFRKQDMIFRLQRLSPKSRLKGADMLIDTFQREVSDLSTFLYSLLNRKHPLFDSEELADLAAAFSFFSRNTWFLSSYIADEFPPIDGEKRRHRLAALEIQTERVRDLIDAILACPETCSDGRIILETETSDTVVDTAT